MSDWANQIAGTLCEYDPPTEWQIAAALRKAKADGVRQVLEMIQAAAMLRDQPNELLSHLANKIERGEA